MAEKTITLKEKSTEIQKGIPIVTTNEIDGYEILEVKGLVWASSVKAKSIFKDIIAMFRIMWGGDVDEYWELVNEARHEILEKLNKNAKEIDANGIIGLKLVTSQIVPGTVEIMAYGTAVKIEPKRKSR
ncbi:MAG: YbjQ family protein [Candidatus Diapherotrites archaeon]|nr:YbjQ family protein [Candidatus Diapherotrites archaeon]